MTTPTPCACEAVNLHAGMLAVEQDAITHTPDVCRATEPGFVSFATYAEHGLTKAGA